MADNSEDNFVPNVIPNRNRRQQRPRRRENSRCTIDSSFLPYMLMTATSTDLTPVFACVASATALVTALHREQHPRQQGFVDVLEAKSDHDFFAHLRLTRNSFATVLQLIKDTYGPSPPRTLLYLGPKEALYLTLWYLGNKTTYREISELFGFSQSTVFECVQRVIDVLCAAGKKYITWPKHQKVNEIANEFKALGGLPGVIGAVDGTHIHIKAPASTQADYVDRTQRHSVNLMAVCTPDLKYSFIQAGFPGSAHDSRVFKSTSLYKKMQNNPNVFFPSPSYHLVGDSAFSLHNYLMIPFKNTGNLSAAQIRFNQKLSKARVLIENSFGLLKGRFRRLQYIDTDIQRVAKIIKACVVLHNIALDHPHEGELLDISEPNIPASSDDDGPETAAHQHEGILKRQRLLLES